MSSENFIEERFVFIHILFIRKMFKKSDYFDEEKTANYNIIRITINLN